MFGFGLGFAFYVFNSIINVYTFCEFYLKMIKINYINPFLTNVLGIKIEEKQFVVSKEFISNGSVVGKKMI